MVFLAIVYIDDGIFACRSLLDAQSASKLVRSDLQLSGWKSNEKKSNWEPRQLGEWLGIIVDTIRMLFIIPEKKIVKLKSVLTGLINEFPNLRVRDVARVSGFVISLSVALGPIARLFTRQMYFFIQLRHSSSSETQGQSVGPGEKARGKFSSTGGRAPGYRLSPDHFQTVK